MKLSHVLRSFVITLFPLFITQCMEQSGDPKLTEEWEPIPPVVTPGEDTPPSDAIVLLRNNNLSDWQSIIDGGPAKWELKDGVLTVGVGTGDIKTKKEFGSIQLHIEWRVPQQVTGDGQNRGNSGIFLQERYELQVLDSYNNRTYSNGQAGSIYKQAIPLVNAMKKPGEWNTFEVIYNAPKFNDAGKLNKPATITVLHNGVLIQNNTEIKGTTEYIGPPKVQSHGKASIQLQDHGSPVSFRNIWVRELG